MVKNISKRKNILIIGGGPAGMACAMELSKGGRKLTIIEKDESIGGMAKTLQFREEGLLFRTDIGPHRFFSKNPYLYKFIEELLGKDWKATPRKTRQFIRGKFYDYPINFMQALRNIGVIQSGIMVADYLASRLHFKIINKKIKNFEDYIVFNFGRKLGQLNMLSYTEKIWGIPCKKIHPDWARQRIKGLNLTSALKNSLFKKKNSPKTLIDTFYYPKYGTGTIYKTIAEKITKAKNKIHTKSFPTKIKHSKNKIDQVEVNIKGKRKIFKPEILVESIPLNEFLNLLEPKPPKEVLNAIDKLRWRSQVYLFITLNKPRLTKDNWIYFPSKKIPFGRIAEMKNFSEEMSPKDKTSLFVEFFVFENDRIWNMPKEKLFDLAFKHFKESNFFKRSDVRNIYLIKRKNVYPVYDLNYQKYLNIIKKYLDNFSNLFYIGRPGRFKYNNQDHSLEMGILAAKSIIEQKSYDIEKVGSEEEYFEEGGIKLGEREKNSYNWMILEDRGTTKRKEI